MYRTNTRPPWEDDESEDEARERTYHDEADGFDAWRQRADERRRTLPIVECRTSAVAD